MVITRTSATFSALQSKINNIVYHFQNWTGIFNPLYDEIVASFQGLPFHYFSIYKAGNSSIFAEGLTEFQDLIVFLNSKESIRHVVCAQ